jgi:hypothetical protein
MECTFDAFLVKFEQLLKQVNNENNDLKDGIGSQQKLNPCAPFHKAIICAFRAKHLRAYFNISVNISEFIIDHCAIY